MLAGRVLRLEQREDCAASSLRREWVGDTTLMRISAQKALALLVIN